LHCAERWQQSSYKEAVLAAIRSTLKTLEATSLASVEQLAGYRIGIALRDMNDGEDHRYSRPAIQRVLDGTGLTRIRELLAMG
jgi:hypothetical protein